MNSLIVNCSSHIFDTESSVITIPSDKSISHRSIIFASLAKGRSTIENLLVSEDISRTINFFKALGVVFTQEVSNRFVIESAGYNNFTNVKLTGDKFYMGNSGTSCRLLMGVAAGINTNSNFIFTGDSSLSKRPMLRVITPLVAMGANISHNQGKLPIEIQGNTIKKTVEHKQEVASAQVKSAILLAALVSGVRTSYEETIPTRNHTENMLKMLNIDISVTDNKIVVNNHKQDIPAFNYNVPRDFSSAAFIIVLSLIGHNCQVTITKVLLNPLRTGLLIVLQRMGAKILIKNERVYNSELIGDIIVVSSQLRGVEVEKELASNLIDEYPILACACACAEGQSVFYGVEELKYKESNRAQTICDNLNILGINSCLVNNNIIINGNKNSVLPGKVIKSNGDHRIAMAFAILGTVIKGQTKILDTACIKTSFPNFLQLLQQLNVNIIQG